MATVQQVNNLTWNPTGKDGKKSVALVVVDSTVSTDWRISVTGAIQTSAGNVEPHFLTIDNIPNNGTVTINFGSYQFAVPPFQRETFELPDGINQIEILATVGKVNCWISEEKLANDQTNQLLVSQTAAATLTYIYVNYSANAPQVTGDLNKTVQFTPIAGNIVYSLMAVPSPVPNGWFQFLENDGTHNVSIAPAGADTLYYNGVTYSAAKPLILYPGAGGELTSDGTKWYYKGTVGTGYDVGYFESPEFSMSNPVLQSFAHGLPGVPTVELCMRCKVAGAGGYAVGDTIAVNSNFGTASGYSIGANATNVYMSANSGTYNSQINSVALNGANFAATSPSFMFFLRARLQLQP